MSHEPYLCRLSALDSYLSAGFTTGALRVPMWSLGDARGLGASFGTATLRATVVAKDRTRVDGCAGRKADASALGELLQSLVAIMRIVWCQRLRCEPN